MVGLLETFVGVYYLTAERARSLKLADINSGAVGQGAEVYPVQQFKGSRFNAIWDEQAYSVLSIPTVSSTSNLDNRNQNQIIRL
jgi:hypothetical protein